MTATNREYERYLGWLSTQDDISADIKRVANIIYNHFDEIEVQQRRRVSAQKF
jgi:hypothetical protein